MRENWSGRLCSKRQQGGGSILFWMAIHNGNIISPHIIEGTITSGKLFIAVHSEFV